MAMTETRPPASPPASAEPRTFGSDARIRVRAFGVADAGELGLAFMSALALVWLVYERLTPLSGTLGFWVCVYAAFVFVAWFIAREQRGAVAARDQIVRIVVWSGGLGLIVPLTLMVIVVFGRGYHAMTLHFLTQDQHLVGPLDAPKSGGAAAAIVGTLEQVGIAALISVPLGVATAVFLNEVGGPLARPVRTIVDAMSAIPSIVAGLFIYAVWLIEFHFSPSGVAVAFALSILFLPTVTRTSELVFRLVPGGLREASLALGSTEWRTTRYVVLPTSRGGLTTAIILSIARVIGEAAPLLLLAGGASKLDWNPFHRQDGLPLFIYKNYLLISHPNTIPRAWTAALVLLAMVLILFVGARLLGGRGVDHIGRLRRYRLARKGLA